MMYYVKSIISNLYSLPLLFVSFYRSVIVVFIFIIISHAMFLPFVVLLKAKT